MSLSMTQLRAETLEHLGIDPTDLDASGTANLDLLINRSWWDLIDKEEFKEKEKTTTFLTVSGTKLYTLASIIGADIFEALGEVSILEKNTNQHIPLNPISLGWYEENFNESTTQQAQPTNFFHYNSNLYLYPTPDSSYTINVWYKYILSDLTAGNPAIPQAWHELIMYGAVARGHVRARDFTSAKMMEQELEYRRSQRKSTQAKDDKEMKLAGIQVYRNNYSVRH